MLEYKISMWICYYSISLGSAGLFHSAERELAGLFAFYQ